MTRDAPGPRLTDPRPFVTWEQAARLVPRRAFAPIETYFDGHLPALTSALARWLPGFTEVVLQENPDNYGIYLRRPHVPAPFLWLGLGWGSDDPPDVLPSWGASLEVNFEWVEPFLRGDAGLRAAWEAAARAAPERVGLHYFEGHVELAEWRSFAWLLAQPDQREAMRSFWAGYLELLAASGVPAAVDEFIRIAVESG